MFLYLDTSALAKMYIIEIGTEEVNRAISDAETTGTVTLARVEMTAAIGKTVRMGALEQADALNSLKKFRNEWTNLTRIQVTDHLITRADALAWEHNLRGYDAVHLAAALIWHEGLGEPVMFATFDQSLWTAAQREGLIPFPEDLTPYVKTKRKNEA